MIAISNLISTWMSVINAHFCAYCVLIKERNENTEILYYLYINLVLFVKGH